MTAGLALALVAAVSLGGAARAPTPSEAFRELNAWRAAAGIPPVREFRAAWNQGCALHNRYTQHIGRLEHFEQTSDGFYTPAGDDAARNSELVTIEAGPRRAFIDGVYHRLTVLQPRLRASGFSASYGSTCLRTAGPGVIDDETRTPDLTLYPWPPKGARDQPTTWGLAALELPSPLDDAPGARTLGLLLSVSVNGPWATSLDPRSTVTQASLVADGGKPVPLAISDTRSVNGDFLDGGFALLPRAALAPLTWYTAHAEGSVSARGVTYPFRLTWRVRTRATCTAARIVAPLSVAVRAGVARFSVQLSCGGEPLAGERLTLVQISSSGARRTLLTFPTVAGPLPVIARPGRNAIALELSFAGGHGLRATRHLVKLVSR